MMRRIITATLQEFLQGEGFDVAVASDGPLGARRSRAVRA